jgi:hypothetical protein
MIHLLNNYYGIVVPKCTYDFKIKHKKLNYRELDFACDFAGYEQALKDLKKLSPK